MKFRRCCGALAAAMLAGTLTISAAAAAPVAVQINGNEVQWTDASPFVADGHTLVPMRAAAEAMGLEVNWNDITRSAEFSYTYSRDKAPEVIESEDGTDYLTYLEVSMKIGEPRCLVTYGYTRYDADGNEIRYQGKTYAEAMDTAAVIQDGHTYAPISNLAAHFGYDVLWDGATKTVMLEPAQATEWSDALMQVKRGGEPSGEWVLAFYDLDGIASLEVTDAAMSYQKGGEEITEPVRMQPLTAEEAAQLAATSPDLEDKTDVMMYWVSKDDIEQETDCSLFYRVEIVKDNGASYSVLHHTTIEKE